MSNKYPEKGVTIIALIDDILPSSDISFSVITLFNVVLGELKSVRVEEGQVYMTPNVMQMKLTVIKKNDKI